MIYDCTGTGYEVNPRGGTLPRMHTIYDPWIDRHQNGVLSAADRWRFSRTLRKLPPKATVLLDQEVPKYDPGDPAVDSYYRLIGAWAAYTRPDCTFGIWDCHHGDVAVAVCYVGADTASEFDRVRRRAIWAGPDDEGEVVAMCCRAVIKPGPLELLPAERWRELLTVILDTGVDVAVWARNYNWWQMESLEIAEGLTAGTE